MGFTYPTTRETVSYYQRPLAKGRTFRCASCGRIKRVKYVPTSDLCRRCAAKNRLKVPNELVSITDDVVVTSVVQKRLRGKAETEIPDDITAVEDKMKMGVFTFFIITGVILFLNTKGMVSLFALGWGLALPFLITFGVSKLLFDKPKRERNEKIQLRMRELAGERKREIEQRKQVYAAPEWGKLRKQVIKENGRKCAQCGKFIKNNDELTVDHMQPISKYPDLVFKRDNLQVLCRQFNSAKRDREI